MCNGSRPFQAGRAAPRTRRVLAVALVLQPLLGHRLGTSLQQMGLLSPITLGALNGTLTELEFYRMIRARKSFGRYQKELFRKAVERGHPELARRMARHLLAQGDNRFLRRQLQALG